VSAEVIDATGNIVTPGLTDMRALGRTGSKRQGDD
jgi:dihydroorotase-like cyclic amidohydrolase